MIHCWILIYNTGVNEEGRLQSRLPGEVAEWSIATVLKTVDPRGSVGSNPTLSAIISAVLPTYTHTTPWAIQVRGSGTTFRLYFHVLGPDDAFGRLG